MINIKCGDPKNKPASYTRFLLPFAYQLEKKEKDAKYYYSPSEKGDDQIWRERYLTRETADVLFRRTKCFILKSGDNKEWERKFEMVSLNGEIFSVGISPPSIILFEYPLNPKEVKKEEKIHPLRTGFLQVELYFNESSRNSATLDDLLSLNELFRYWQQPFEGHENDYINGFENRFWKIDREERIKDIYDNEITERLEEFPQEVKFPDDLKKISYNCSKQLLILKGRMSRAEKEKLVGLSANDHYKRAIEGLFEKSQKKIREIYFEWWAGLLEMPIRHKDTDKTHLRLFPEDWRECARDEVSGKKLKEHKDGIPKPNWLVHADNRAFVWTCATMEGGGEKLRHSFGKKDAKAWEFGHWIKLLNVDRPGDDFLKSGFCTEFEKKWAEERTYKRWEEWGTFYGFTYHSGAMLGPDDKKLPMWKHFGQMYFDQTLLLLYLRVTLFRFSEKLNLISGKAINEGLKKGEGDWEKDFQKLRWPFALFTNLYQFPLLSNQQQAVEMYTLARKYMDVDDLFKEIQKEIESSHEYLAIREGQEQTKITTLLTVVATIGMSLALATGFWGMNIVVSSYSQLTPAYQLWAFIGSIIIFLLSLIVVVFFSKPISKILNWLADRFK